jgi:hypothetical protein
MMATSSGATSGTKMKFRCGKTMQPGFPLGPLNLSLPTVIYMAANRQAGHSYFCGLGTAATFHTKSKFIPKVGIF